MAGVNHKKVKQLIHQKVKTINDRQFFSSRVIAGHFADMAAVQVKRYGYNRKVKVKCVWEPKNQNVACTQGELIWINAGHSLIKRKKTRPERYEIVCGLFAHELGHLLYTDFLASQTYGNVLATGKWYPGTPPLQSWDEKANEADIWAYIKSDEKRMAAFLNMAHNITNILEDGYVDNKMQVRFPGKLGSCLRYMSSIQFDDMSTLSELIEREDEEGGHIWWTIMQLMCSYMLWGELKYGQEPLSDERVQLVFSMLNELDTALTDPSHKARLHITNVILVRCWKHIKSFLELCEELSQNASASGNPTSASDLATQIMSALAGASQQGSGNSQPIEDADDAQGIPVSAGGKRAQTAQQAASSMPAGTQDEEDGRAGDPANAGTASDEGKDPSDGGAGAENAEDGDDAQMSAIPTVPEDPDGDEPDNAADDTGEQSPGAPMEGAPQAPQNVSKDETGRLPLERTDRLYAPTEDGDIMRDDDYAGSGYENAASDVERLLESMAEQSVFKDLETKRTSELNDLARGISYGNAHAGIDMHVKRITEVDEDLTDQYNAVSGDLKKISVKLQRSVQQKLQDKRRGGKLTNLLIGRRIDPHALPRNDAHVFSKSILPNEAPELALALLLDESGSMASRDRATYARSTAVILHDFCRSLRIPVMIYGHSTGYGSDVDLFSYAEFDEIDRNDCFRLMDISARNTNRDGAALRYTAEQLSKRPEEVKILILVSDGQPNHFGYGGTAAEDDLRGIKQEYERRGILFVAAAIGDDKANIERIYGDSFLDITDLNKLPVMLTNVIKQHMRV